MIFDVPESGASKKLFVSYVPVRIKSEFNARLDET